MGVVTRIVMVTMEGSECKEGQEEAEDIGDTMVESLFLMDHCQLASNMIPYKVINHIAWTLQQWNLLYSHGVPGSRRPCGVESR